MMRSQCPDPNDLAAFADGALDETARQRVVLHLDECPDCRSVVAETSEFLHQERRQRTLVGTWGRRAAVAAVAASLLVVGSLVGFFELFEPATTERRSATAVAENLGDYRPIRPRLSGFRYTPYTDDTRSGERPVRLAEDLRRTASAFPATRSLATEASPETLHGTALVHLVLENRSQAVAALEMAERDTEGEWPAERRARLLSDLAAARLGDWERADDPMGPIRALDAADEALALAPELPEALFNRALALEALSLNRAAAEAWRNYLRVDPGSGWAGEARAGLAALEADPGPDWESDRETLLDATVSGDDELVDRLVERHRQRARILVQDELLARWGERFPDGGWREPLAAAEAITAALTAQTGDLLLHRTLERIEEALVSGSNEIHGLARGHAAFGRGRVAFNDWRLAEAEAELVSSARSLEAANSPFHLWARIWRLACRYYGDEGMESLSTRLAEIQDEARRGEAHALLATALWLDGLAEVVRRDITTGVLAYRAAAEAFTRVGERDHLAFLEFLLAESTMLLGDELSSWALWLGALERAPVMADRRKASGIRYSAAVAALSGGAPRSALALVEENLADPGLSDPVSRAEARLLRVRILAELDRGEEALEALHALPDLVAEIPDPSIAGRFETKLATTEVVLEPGSRTEAMIARLSDRIEASHSTGVTFRLPELYLARARTWLALGRAPEAIDDVARGFALLRGHASRGSDAFWLAQFPRGEIVEGLVEASLTEIGDPDAAFRIVEASRLQPRPGNGGSSGAALPTTPESVRSALSAGEVFVNLVGHHDSVTAWILTPTDARVATVEMPRSGIEARAGRLVRDLADRRWGDGSRRAAEELYAALVGPIDQLSPSSQRLILSADEPLRGVPFALLRNPVTDSFLVEEREVITVPSGGFLVEARKGGEPAPGPRVGEPASVLAVGNPAHEPRLFPRLRDLPGAEQEARRVATVYPTSDLLTGRRATETDFKRKAARFDVIHVAAHATADRPELARSSLVLAPDAVAGEEGVLFSDEIVGMDLRHTAAVVLSACGTGRRGPGGSDSLARAFLAAGARATIASLWDVDDTGTVELSTALHRRLAAGATPSAALRGAQLELLSSGDSSPWVWGAFQVSGG